MYFDLLLVRFVGSTISVLYFFNLSIYWNLIYMALLLCQYNHFINFSKHYNYVLSFLTNYTHSTKNNPQINEWNDCEHQRTIMTCIGFKFLVSMGDGVFIVNKINVQPFLVFTLDEEIQLDSKHHKNRVVYIA